MKNKWKALAGVAVAAALVLAPIMATGAVATEGGGDDAVAEKKVFVCKYVGTPGVNEHADHVISVSTSTLDGFDGATLPFVFADGQNQSVAIAFDTGQPEPSIDECPAGDPTPEDFPIPDQFNAAPTVTCGEADSFDTSFLGTPLSTEGDVSIYQFQNIYVHVDRSVAGKVTLTISPIPGFTISGLSDEWDEGEANFSRTIELNEPEACPLADIPVTLTDPTIVARCGVNNDEILIPASTDGVTYYWEDEEDSDNANVVAVVEAGYVLEAVPAGWEQVDEYVYLFASETEPNDEPCPVTPTPTPVPALAATGGDVNPVLPIGAGMLMLTGVALMVARRLIRH